MSAFWFSLRRNLSVSSRATKSFQPQMKQIWIAESSKPRATAASAANPAEKSHSRRNFEIGPSIGKRGDCKLHAYSVQSA
jgi:hypothetical protein